MSKKVCLSAETSPKMKGGTERLTIDERRVPEVEVRRNRNTEHLPQAGGGGAGCCCCCCCYHLLASKLHSRPRCHLDAETFKSYLVVFFANSVRFWHYKTQSNGLEHGQG